LPHSKTKKDVAITATSVIENLPVKVRGLPAQKCNLTAEVDDRHRRPAIAYITYNLSTILRFEIAVPEIIQRNATRRRRGF